MKQKSKKIISLIILVLGITLIVTGIILVKNNKVPTNNNFPSENGDNDKLNQAQQPILEIQNFTIDKNIENEIRLSFDILNDNDKENSTKKIYINFYDGDKILFTFEYAIEKSMVADERRNVEGILSFEYQNITKYELVINDVKKELEPIYK